MHVLLFFSRLQQWLRMSAVRQMCQQKLCGCLQSNTMRHWSPLWVTKSPSKVLLPTILQRRSVHKMHKTRMRGRWRVSPSSCMPKWKVCWSLQLCSQRKLYSEESQGKMPVLRRVSRRPLQHRLFPKYVKWHRIQILKYLEQNFTHSHFSTRTQAWMHSRCRLSK